MLFEKLKKLAYAAALAARLRFSFFMRLRCHFHLICRFFFQRRELLFI